MDITSNYSRKNTLTNSWKLIFKMSPFYFLNVFFILFYLFLAAIKINLFDRKYLYEPPTPLQLNKKSH